LENNEAVGLAILQAHNFRLITKVNDVGVKKMVNFAIAIRNPKK
jgi:hypothetical protein